jgi:hypothetical protein
MSYALQWSEEEHQFHVEETASVTKNAIADFLGRFPDTYITLAIVPTYEEADQLSRELAKKRGLVWSEGDMRWEDSKPR